MKLKKTYDSDTVQGFKIINPTEEFKQKYPKKFLYIFLFNSTRYLVENADKIPLIAIYLKLKGYVFSYNKVNLKTLDYRSYREKIDNIPRLTNLKTVFPKNDNILIHFTHLTRSDPTFITPFQLSFFVDVSTMTPEKFKNILSECFEKFNIRPQSVADFVEKMLKHTPFTVDEFPIKFPDIIDEKALNKKTDVTQLYITYDLRMKNIKEEFSIARIIDTVFIPKNTKIKIYDDYNGLAREIAEKLGIKLKKDHIEITYGEYLDFSREFNKFDLIDAF